MEKLVKDLHKPPKPPEGRKKDAAGNLSGDLRTVEAESEYKGICERKAERSG